MTDTERFASLDELAQIRTRLVDDYTVRRQAALGAETSAPLYELDSYVSGRLRNQSNPTQEALYDLDLYANQKQAEGEGRLAELKRRAAAFELARSMPTADEQRQAQSAVQRVAGAGLQGLDTVLNVLDSPRRWTYDHAILPLLQKNGIAPAEGMGNTGYDVYVKALGGEAIQHWFRDRMRDAGADEGWAERTTAFSSGLAGLALDVAFDPLTYVTFGAAGVVKAGGKALGTKGIQVARAATKTSVVTGAEAALLRKTASKLDDPLTKLASEAAAQTDEPVRIVGGALAKDVGTALGEASELASVRGKLLRASQGEADRLTPPEVDRMFAALRGIGVEDDLFKRGGTHVTLPFNAASMHIPFLNREENLSVFLGGREITPSAARIFDDVRRTMVDLGEGALAKVQVPKALQASLGGVRDAFINYGYIQGFGSGALREMFKQVGNVKRVESKAAAQAANDVFAGLDEGQRQITRYLLDIGATKYQTDPTTGAMLRDATTGAPIPLTQTLDDLADEIAAANGQPVSAIDAVTGDRVWLDNKGLPTAENPLRARLEAQKAELTGELEHLDRSRSLAGRPKIAPQTLPDTLRPRNPGRPLPAATVYQRMIERVGNMLDTSTVAARHTTSELVTGDPARFAAIVPDPAVRNALTELFKLESDAFGLPQGQGLVAATTELAQRLGFQSSLQNYMRRIYVTDTPGLMERLRGKATPQRLRKPAEVGKQRTASFLLEPEELIARGVSTDPQKALGLTVGQYRTLAAENTFLGGMLEQYGKRIRPDERPPEGWVRFNPKAWYQQGIPADSVVEAEIKTLREVGELADAEADALLDLASRRAGAKDIPRGEVWAIPQYIERGLTETRNAAKNAGGIYAIADTYMSLWRTMQTVIWPAYHFRNMTGNFYLSHMGGVSMTDMRSFHAARRILGTQGGDEALKEYLADANLTATSLGQTRRLDVNQPGVSGDLTRLLEERGVLNAGSASTEAISRQMASRGEPGNPADWINNNPVFRFGRNASQATDNTMRMRHIIGRLKQGDTLEDAILSTKRFLFDTQDLAPFERNVMRNVTSFYSWTRKNIPLQLEMLVHEPRYGSYWAHMFRAASDREAQKDADAALLPAYVREQLGIVTGVSEDGKLQIISGFGLPIEDLNQFNIRAPGDVVRRLANLSNPIIQAMFIAQGGNVPFTGRPVDDEQLDNYYRQLGPAAAWIARQIPGVAAWLDIKEANIVDSKGRTISRYTADPVKIYTLSSVLGLGRLLRTTNQAGRIAESADPGDEAKNFALRNLGGFREIKLDISRDPDVLSPTTTSAELDEEINGKIDALAQRFDAGEISGTQYREARKELLDERRIKRDQMREDQLDKSEAGKLTEQERGAIDKVRSKFRGVSGRLRDALYDLDPDGQNPVTGQPFTSITEFYDTREALMAGIREESPEAYTQIARGREKTLKSMPPTGQKIEREYEVARMFYAEYAAVPKYRRVDPAQQPQVDAAYDKLRELSRRTGNPKVARSTLARIDPDAYALVVQAKTNSKERRQAWQKLDRESGGLLTRFYGNVPEVEFAGIGEGA